MLAPQYNPAAIETATYQAWEQSEVFTSTPRENKGAYSILLPPPNVTGSLHMGHAFQHSIMDALIRYHRMQGKDVLWQVGTDHAGVGTHIVVTRHLRGQGIDPDTLTREEFLQKVLEWKEGSASSIGTQMRRLGDSCDWSRECFTLDPTLSAVVRDVFIQLYDEGMIYRGKRLVNWDPKLLTALADLEVVSNEEEGVLYHVRYPFVDKSDGEGMIIATTRPETILVDGAVAVAPNDERYAKFVGKKVHVPCTNREILIIEDEHVDPKFGSGCVKITAAHDFNDYEVAKRHPDVDIPIIELMTPDAHLNDNAPPDYRGLDRYAARKKIVQDLDDQGLLVKAEPHKYMLPRGERSRVVVEPMLSDQWYLKTDVLAKKALSTVQEGRLQFVPNQWRNVYENWLTNVKDWCISRQIDWGHRIPAWIDDKGNIFVAKDLNEAQQKCGDERELTQVEDVLDTWFSSALWPLSTLGWPNQQDAHFAHYFPTSTLVTGNDIIFFWVARMVMMSEHLTGKTPFDQVYMHGLVRDQNGEKMSKSRGNVLDPLDLIDGISLEDLLAKRITPELLEDQAKQIEKRTRKEFPEGIASYGTDALRLTFASLASHGRDINFDLGRIDGHRRLCTKLWQATRFVLGVVDSDQVYAEPNLSEIENGVAEQWIISRLQHTTKNCTEHFANYRFDLIVEELTNLLRDDFCDWYIELAKINIKRKQNTDVVKQTLVNVLAVILRLAHPIIPFITNELWKVVGPLAMPDYPEIIVAPYPICDEQKINNMAEKQLSIFKTVVHDVRSLRSSLGIDPGQQLTVQLETKCPQTIQWVDQLGVLARLETIKQVDKIQTSGDNPILLSSNCRFCFELGSEHSGWRKRLQKKYDILEKQYNQTQQRLDNKGFVDSAPADVVEAQRQKLEKQKIALNEIKELLVGENK